MAKPQFAPMMALAVAACCLFSMPEACGQLRPQRTAMLCNSAAPSTPRKPLSLRSNLEGNRFFLFSLDRLLQERTHRPPHLNGIHQPAAECHAAARKGVLQFVIRNGSSEGAASPQRESHPSPIR